MSRTRGMEFRVYVEGILLPVQPRAIQVNSAAGVPAHVSISLPPFNHKVLASLKPRTHVAAFWRDLDNFDRSDSQWRLLGEGEVSGYSHGKSANGYMYADLGIETLDNQWASTYAMVFQGMNVLSSSQGGESVLLFGTNATVTREVNSEGQFVLPIETTIQSLLKKEGLFIPELFAEMLTFVRDASEYFKTVDDRLHISSRLAYVPDEEIKSFISKRQAAGVLNKVFTEFPEDGRLITILMAMLRNVSYLYQSCPMPTLVEKSLKQFFLIPDVPFAAPPRCNTFFSSTVTTWGFSRSFLAEPTRARYLGPPVGKEDGVLLEQYYAPEPIQKLADRMKSGSEPGKTIDGLMLRSTDDVRPESREDEKGVIPMSERFQAYEAFSFEDPDVQARRKYFTGLVEYDLLLAQHRGRQLSISMPFTPNPVAGMPGVFIDDNAIIFGMVVSVSHAIVAEGAPETQVTMAVCREEDFADLTMPTWKNTAFTDPKKLDDTYAAFFGKGHASIMAPFQAGSAAVGSRHAKQIQAARDLLKAHNASPDPASFSAAYASREVVDLRGFMEFVGARHEGGNYTGGPFRTAWTVAAKQMAQQLSVQAQDVP